MRRLTVLLLVCTAALAGCGDTVEVREPDLVAESGLSTAPRPRDRDDADRTGAVRIAVVTHGQAASSFWAIVRNGVDAAARQMDVSVDYRSPDAFSVERMSRLVDEAVATRPDALAVSLPSSDITPAVRRAVDAGIPVVSINSGADLFERVGALAHIGQDEERAGEEAGERFARYGVKRAVCVNQEVGNRGLDLRCAGFARAIADAGGRARVLPVDGNDPAAIERRVRQALRTAPVDGILTLNANVARSAFRVLRQQGALRRISLATFDLSPEVLAAVDAGRMRFAVDQQAFLQGYLPIVLLAHQVRYDLLPAQGQVIPTGPHFVTPATADRALRLSRRGFR